MVRLVVSLWLIFGSFAGLIAGRPMVRRVAGGRIGCAATGALGGFLGGALLTMAAGEGSLTASVVGPPAAFVGGLLLLAIMGRAAAPVDSRHPQRVPD
jgi:uncharacterized membrane protein YeaQ/YmgE (transglycosylase-associated protein family)